MCRDWPRGGHGSHEAPAGRRGGDLGAAAGPGPEAGAPAGCGGARVATHWVVGSSLFSVWKARSLTQRKDGGLVADVMRLEKV